MVYKQMGRGGGLKYKLGTGRYENGWGGIEKGFRPVVKKSVGGTEKGLHSIEKCWVAQKRDWIV